MLIYNIVLYFLKNGEKTNISEINGEKYSKIAIYFLVVYLAFFSILQYDYINITKGELINVKKSFNTCT